MNKIKKNTYTYFDNIIGESQDEANLVNSLLTDSSFSKKEELSEKVLKLPFNEQVHAIHYILANMYVLATEESNKKNKEIEEFLALPAFIDHRSIILSIIDKKNCSNFEKKYNIKIVLSTD
jgi:hypothetical protein